jgi:hypothetical protein
VEAAEALSVVRVAVGEGKHRMVHLHDSICTAW